MKPITIQPNSEVVIVNFRLLDSDVPLTPSDGVYISQIVLYARVCTDGIDFNEHNQCITGKLLCQEFRYNRLIKTFT